MNTTIEILREAMGKTIASFETVESPIDSIEKVTLSFTDGTSMTLFPSVIGGDAVILARTTS